MLMTTTVFRRLNIEPNDFKDIHEFTAYSEMNKDERAEILAKDIVTNFKAIDDNTFYYFDQTVKLWQCIHKEKFFDFIVQYNCAILKKVHKFLESLPLAMRPNSKTLINSLDSRKYSEEIAKLTRRYIETPEFINCLDSKPYIFSLQEGKKIDFRTLTVSDRERDDYITKESPVSYVLQTPMADNFFNKIMIDETAREYLRGVLGYSLTAETNLRSFYVWFGHGANGKSMIMELMRLILGEFYTQCDKSIFLKTKDNGKGASPELCALMHKRIGVYSEGETKDKIEINFSALKQISGEDTITARQLYSSPIEFRPYCKLHLLTNFTPGMNEERAIVDRLQYVFMDSRFSDNPKKGEFKKDTEFTNKLKTVYLSQVFSWIAKGAYAYYKNGKSIEQPIDFIARTKKLFETEDSISTFLNRRINKTDNKKDCVKKSELWEAYTQFCNENSQQIHRRSELFDRLKELNINTSVVHGYDVYRNIKLVPYVLMDDMNDEIKYNVTEEDDADHLHTIQQLMKKIEALESKNKNLEIKLSQFTSPVPKTYTFTKRDEVIYPLAATDYIDEEEEEEEEEEDVCDEDNDPLVKAINKPSEDDNEDDNEDEYEEINGDDITELF